MPKKWLTKMEEQQIIKTYSLRKGEIVTYNGTAYLYEITTVRKSGGCALIKIEPEQQNDYINEQPRILVRHSDSKGHTVFVDVWDRDNDGNLYWKFRNSIDAPISDREYINQIEEDLEKIKNEYQKLNDTKMAKPAGRKPDSERLLENALKVKKLLEQGLKEKDVVKEMGISRATYFRYKKLAFNL